MDSRRRSLGLRDHSTGCPQPAQLPIFPSTPRFTSLDAAWSMTWGLEELLDHGCIPACDDRDTPAALAAMAHPRYAAIPAAARLRRMRTVRGDRPATAWHLPSALAYCPIPDVSRGGSCPIWRGPPPLMEVADWAPLHTNTCGLCRELILQPPCSEPCPPHNKHEPAYVSARSYCCSRVAMDGPVVHRQTAAPLLRTILPHLRLQQVRCSWPPALLGQPASHRPSAGSTLAGARTRIRRAPWRSSLAPAIVTP